jgi:hypothetical protein
MIWSGTEPTSRGQSYALGRPAHRVLLPTLLALSTATYAASAHANPLVVMTQNMDEGTDYQALAAATGVPAFLAAVTQTYQDIAATDPAVRAMAMAHEIAAQQPALIGLQEASTVRTGPSPPALTVSSDLLQSLLTDLGNLGLHYQAVAVSPRLDAEAPSTLGFDVRLTTRDAILARTDLPGFSVTNPQSQSFATQLAVPTPVGTISFDRGWSSVDATLDGQTFRFIDTHLDTGAAAPIQLAQVKELLAGADTSGLPAVYVGDFNTSANDPTDPTFATYQALSTSGLIDTWTAANPGNPGDTCCQAPDLMNPVSQLNQRGDLILASAGFTPISASLLGNDPADRTSSGLWPSDHAGVVDALDVSIPEPTSLVLLATGAFAPLALVSRRRANPVQGRSMAAADGDAARAAGPAQPVIC